MTIDTTTLDTCDYEMPPNAQSTQPMAEEQPLLEGHQDDDDYDQDGKKESPLVPSNKTFAQAAGLRCRKMANKFIEAEQGMRKMLIDAGHEIDHVCHLPFSKLPKWLQDNDYLHHFHRRPMPCVKACFKSIFQLHTETINIWTHGIGCLTFIGLSIYLFFYSEYAALPFMDKIIIGIFLGTAILCLGLSTCYHTLSCHSLHVCSLFSKLDYCGISMLIAGSIVPCLYYGFYCSVSSQLGYTILILGLCVASVIVSLDDRFSEAHYRHVRALVFTAFAFSSVVPALHWYLVHGETAARVSESLQSALKFLALMIFLYITGVVFYALRIPERFFPGKFDIFFHSHQLFHCFVFAAAIAHLQGITCMADFRLFEQQQEEAMCLQS